MNQQPSSSSSSSRLPSFRNYSDIQKNISKILNKKNYIPNLSVSRNAAPKPKIEENVIEEIKKDLVPKEKRKPKRFERNILPAVETFAPVSDCTRNRISITSKIKTANTGTGVKKETIDRLSSNELHNRQFYNKFDQMSISPIDQPLSVPHFYLSDTDLEKKYLSLLTDILKPEDDSSLILLKTPQYIPGILDKSENPKINFKEDTDKVGHKCSIHDLPEGQIGKLQIMKSGKIRMILGECKYWLQPSVKNMIKEELAVIKTDPESKSGEIINLGDIQTYIKVIPDNISNFNLDL